jgi:16S rRNA (adenine1518-N6/adenine1519-N6)-dimethyltransferase
MTQSGFKGKRLEYLKSKFAKYGIAPTRKLGQNFLLDRNQVIKVCKDGEINPLDTILEVGPGSGLLSTILANTGAALLCVEFDRKLFKLVTEELSGFSNAEVIEGDILAGKKSINPEVLKRIEEIHKNRDAGSLKCVSNLPYSIASPFIANLCENPLPWERGIFMIQYEVAERLAATPKDSSYGNLSIVAALGTKRCTIERSIPPQVFWPRPKVKSAILRMDFLPAEERAKIPWTEMRVITNAIFTSRRKTLKNAFKPLFEKGEKEKLDAFLTFAGLDPKYRGEAFPPKKILEITKKFKEFSNIT